MTNFSSPQEPRQSINADLIGVPGGALQLVTPALVIDLAAMRENLHRMTRQCRDAGMALRPHGKTHKCSVIAREQIAAGAVGICATTGREAIAYSQAGLPGLLVTTPIVQRAHIETLATLHRRGADITLIFDTAENIVEWEAALTGAERLLPAFVDLDLGMGRTGAASISAAVELARRLHGSSALTYAGLQAYSGRVQHILSYTERRAVYLKQIERLRQTLAALEAAALRPPVVSGGGTGTFAIDVEHGLYTESQAGSYALMDVDYDVVELFPDRANPYRFALYLRTSVVSANQPHHVSINAGFKSLSTDGPLPRVRSGQWPGAAYDFFGDEFGLIALAEGAPRPTVGDLVDIEVSHCDPTINLHDYFHVLDGDTVVDIWPVDARGVL
ncbi:DSD1 family PLP-dependent enzyme [Bradyrhizobium quebecense]|uniref:DSD1 family PLP-dependent enzyme n=2 Tax=Bradyrhizobium quebecense TaxID=2748629 RepID=A0ABS3MG47_9BRAD|nr:DSD1 family PLP-dependent enzyme [Bradyrhizobium quebecense]UGY05715.1 DSD1 family PLP-dependent enzyme [Bradyrhizobium quebecense]